VVTVAQYYPLVTWIICLLFIFFLSLTLWNVDSSIWTVALLAAAPAFVPRTAVGFADYDALTFLFILGIFVSWTIALSSTSRSWYLVWSALAGAGLALIFLTWAGAGLLALSVALALTMLAASRKISPSARWGFLLSLSTAALLPLAVEPAFVVPPSDFVFLYFSSVLGSITVLLLSHPKGKKRLSSYTNRKTLTIGMALLLASVMYGSIESSILRRAAYAIYVNSMAPLGNSATMRMVGELHRMNPREWATQTSWAALVLIPALAWFFMRVGRTLVTKPMLFASLSLLPIVVGILTSPSQLDNRITTLDSVFFFALLFCLCGLFLTSVLYRRTGLSTEQNIEDAYVPAKCEAVEILLWAWILVTFVASRGAYRYYTLWELGTTLVSGGFLGYITRWMVKRERIPQHYPMRTVLLSFILCLYKLGMDITYLLSGYHLIRPLPLLVTALLCMLIWYNIPDPVQLSPRNLFFAFGGVVAFCPWFLSGAQDCMQVGKGLAATPSATMLEALAWVKHHVKETPILAWWDQGSLINYFSDAKTVIDENHQFGPERINEAARSVFLSKNPTEARQWMAQRKIGFLFLTGKEMGDLVHMVDFYLPNPQTEHFLYLLMQNPPSVEGRLGRYSVFKFAQPLSIPHALRSSTPSIPRGSVVKGVLISSLLLEKDTDPNALADGVPPVLFELGTPSGERYVKAGASCVRGRSFKAAGGMAGEVYVVPWESSVAKWALIWADHDLASRVGFRLFWSGEILPGFSSVYNNKVFTADKRVKVWSIGPRRLYP
jgi:asparagine N-glycosylation enzyme membrane subunit Stt3